MPYIVCAKYCGSVIELESFDTEDEAYDFMQEPYTLFYEDEIDDGEEDEVIYPDEMWVEYADHDPVVYDPEMYEAEEAEYLLPF